MARADSEMRSGLTRTDIRAEVLTFEDVTVGYGTEPILKNVSFNIRRGEVAGLVALDGRGKSTLVKCAAGLLAPSAGRVLYEGKDIARMGFAEDQRFRNRCSVVLEGGALFANRTILDNVTLPVRYHLGGRLENTTDYVLKLLDRVGFHENVNALPWQVSARGRRLAAFARALVREPELVLVDRFFEALDVADWKRLMELVVELNLKSGTSFLLVGELHPSIFQVAERVIVLEGGAMVAYDFKRALYKNPKIKQAFETSEDEPVRAPASVPVIPDQAPPGAVEPGSTPLETASTGFDPSADSDSQPLVVVDESAGRIPVAGLRADAGDDEGDAGSTMTVLPEAAAAVIAEARRRREERLEAEAAATERGAALPKLKSVSDDARRPRSTSSRALDRRALDAALEITGDTPPRTEPDASSGGTPAAPATKTPEEK